MESVGNLTENNFGEMVGVKPGYHGFRKEQERDSSESLLFHLLFQ